MNYMHRFGAIFAIAAFSGAVGPSYGGEDKDWQWSVPAPLAGGKAPPVHLWLPDGAGPVKGLFLFSYYGCFGGYSKDPELRALAKELQCGVVASEERLGDPHDDPSRILNALAELANKSGHPEVASAPMFIFGHSNSTHDMAQFGKKIPERIIAWVAMKSAFGAQFSVKELYKVPGMVISGELDHEYFQDQLATVKKLRREHGALMHIIVEPAGHHWPERQTYRIMQAFLKTVFYLRVPPDSGMRAAPVKLFELEERSGWLGQNLEGERVRHVEGSKITWSWDRPVNVRQLLTIAPYDRYPADKSTASWLPTEDYARKWQEFCHTGTIKDWSSLPPGTVERWKSRISGKSSR